MDVGTKLFAVTEHLDIFQIVIAERVQYGEDTKVMTKIVGEVGNSVNIHYIMYFSEMWLEEDGTIGSRNVYTTEQKAIAYAIDKAKYKLKEARWKTKCAKKVFDDLKLRVDKQDQ